MTDSRENPVKLEAADVRFYSPSDEAAFFEWLNKIPCVLRIVGEGATIQIHVNSATMSEEDLRELLSLFRRYHVAMGQLSVFDRESFSNWLRDRNSYWFHEVFDT